MELIQVHGDIFDSPCQVLVNPTNSVGVMGAGLAKAFYNKYPVECVAYNKWSLEEQKKRNTQTLVLLPPILVPIQKDIGLHGGVGRYILMFPTKIHWSQASQIWFLKQNLGLTWPILDETKIHSIAFPKLGAGLGGLNPDEVVALITNELSNFKGVSAEIYN